MYVASVQNGRGACCAPFLSYLVFIKPLAHRRRLPQRLLQRRDVLGCLLGPRCERLLHSQSQAKPGGLYRGRCSSDAHQHMLTTALTSSRPPRSVFATSVASSDPPSWSATRGGAATYCTAVGMPSSAGLGAWGAALLQRRRRGLLAGLAGTRSCMKQDDCRGVRGCVRRVSRILLKNIECRKGPSKAGRSMMCSMVHNNGDREHVPPGVPCARHVLIVPERP